MSVEKTIKLEHATIEVIENETMGSIIKIDFGGNLENKIKIKILDGYIRVSFEDSAIIVAESSNVIRIGNTLKAVNG